MARIRLRYVHEFVDRHGSVRRYFRRNGKRTPLPGVPGSKEFMQAYQDLLVGTVPATPVSRDVSPRSIAALIDRYYRTHKWRALKPSTRRVEENIMERIRRDYGSRPAATMPRAAITAIIDGMSETPGAANSFLSAFKKLMKLAIREGWRDDDPTQHVDRVEYPTQGFVSWEEEHIEAFEAKHPAGSRARLAMALLLFTAQRRSDVVRMGWQHVKGGRMDVRQQKTNTPLTIPMHPKLLEELATTQRDRLTFLLTEQGKPFSAAGFGNWFRDVCDEAGLKGLSAHGLRKAAARRLAEAGCTAHEIKAVTGHKRLADVDLYTAKANQTHLADAAFVKQIEAEHRKPTGKLD
jgi:integrase